MENLKEPIITRKKGVDQFIDDNPTLFKEKFKIPFKIVDKDKIFIVVNNLTKFSLGTKINELIWNRYIIKYR